MLKSIGENQIIRFLFKVTVFYIVWLLLYYFIVIPYTNWDYWLNYSIAIISQVIFFVFNVITHIDIESDSVVLLLDAGNYKGIRIGSACNGFTLFSIFSIFILAFPGKRMKKLWYIPLGIIIIHLANIIRVMALVLINNYYPSFMDFNHWYTFTIFVYSIIFLLWYIWVKKMSFDEKSKN